MCCFALDFKSLAFMVYFCYLDESGTPDIPGNTSHYVLSGLAIPINKWKYCDSKINKLKTKFDLGPCEVHTAWIARKYIEQSKISNFEKLSYSDRIYEVEKYRNSEILRLSKSKNTRLYKQTKKNYKQTKPYIHLTHSERMQFLRELADCVGKWSFA